jgi:hypothetical protein
MDDFAEVQIVETAGDPNQLRSLSSAQSRMADTSDAPNPGGLHLDISLRMLGYHHVASTEIPCRIRILLGHSFNRQNIWMFRPLADNHSLAVSLHRRLQVKSSIQLHPEGASYFVNLIGRISVMHTEQFDREDRGVIPYIGEHPNIRDVPNSARSWTRPPERAGNFV